MELGIPQGVSTGRMNMQSVGIQIGQHKKTMVLLTGQNALPIDDRTQVLCQ